MPVQLIHIFLHQKFALPTYKTWVLFLDLFLPGENRCFKGQWGQSSSPLHVERVMGMQPCRLRAVSPALPAHCPFSRLISTGTFIYVMLLEGLKWNGHSEGRKKQSVLLSKTQLLIFYVIIFHYSGVFKAKKSFFFPLFIASITEMCTFPEIIHFC